MNVHIIGEDMSSTVPRERGMHTKVIKHLHNELFASIGTTCTHWLIGMYKQPL